VNTVEFFLVVVIFEDRQRTLQAPFIMTNDLRNWVQCEVSKCIHSQSEAVWLSKNFGYCSVDDFVHAFDFNRLQQGHVEKPSTTSTFERRIITLNVLEHKAVLDGLVALQERDGTMSLFK
jgi:hypothetical protein